MKLSRRLPLCLVAAAALAAAPLSAQTTVFDNFNFPGPVQPNPVLPPNVVSQCLQCDQLNSLGQVITGTQGGTIFSLSFILSDWAVKSQNLLFGTATTYDVPITLNVYAPGDMSTILFGMTQTVTVLYRPEDEAHCGVDGGWGPTCDHGIAQQVTFLPASPWTVGAQFAYTLAFSTQTYGPSPTGVDGPYNSLNFGVRKNNTPLLGTVDSLSYDGSGNPGRYGSGGLQNYDVEHDGALLDDGYTLYAQVQMTTSVAPEPGSIALVGTGLLTIGAVARRRRKQQSA